MKNLLAKVKNIIDLISKKIRAFFGSIFFKDRIVLSSFIVGIILSSVIFIVLIIKVEPTDAPIPTRFNSFWGVSHLGNWFDLYNLFFLSVFLFLLNTLLAYKLFLKERLMSYFLVTSVIFLDIIILIETLGFVILIGK